MSTAEERTKILNMVAEGKISADEAASLLKALGGATRKGSSGDQVSSARMLRVRVTNVQTGKSLANVNVPITLVDVALRMGARFVPELTRIELEEIMNAIRNGQQGKILEVEDDDGGERVEIFVE